MKFYAIEMDDVTYDSNFTLVKKGRKYYTSSSAKCVDPTDIHYAQLFPNDKSVRQGMRVVKRFNPVAIEVEVFVDRIGPAKI